MSDRQLRSKIGQYSTAEETSDEKEIPEITGQTLAQHSEKGLLVNSGEYNTARERVSQFAVHRDSRHTDDGDSRHSTRVL